MTMQDGRMSSRVSVELFGPDGQLKNCNSCQDCSDTECETCPLKEDTE